VHQFPITLEICPDHQKFLTVVAGEHEWSQPTVAGHMDGVAELSVYWKGCSGPVAHDVVFLEVNLPAAIGIEVYPLVRISRSMDDAAYTAGIANSATVTVMLKYGTIHISLRQNSTPLL
jgi:hypothetical protein